MEFNSCVLLYSKYSATSKKLMEFMKTSGVDFTQIIGLQHLCVDNEQVRKKIIKNTQISVLSVPCILLIYQDGGIEKYEGISVFNWCEEIIKHFFPPQIIPPNELPQEVPEVGIINRENRENQENQENRDKKKREIENKKLFEENKRKYEAQQQAKGTRGGSKEPPRVKKITSITDLSSEEEDKYDPGESPKIKVKTKKSSDIMALAQELAQGRESDTSTGSIRPGYP